MTTTQIVTIIGVAFLFPIAMNIGNIFYWKPTCQILSKLLNTSVEYFTPLLPLSMRIKGRYKGREVYCSYNVMLSAGASAIRIAMKPLRELKKEPVLMVSYKKPTTNTVRQGNEIVCVINTGIVKMKKYSEADIVAILDELTKATEKLEVENV